MVQTLVRQIALAHAPRQQLDAGADAHRRHDEVQREVGSLVAADVLHARQRGGDARARCWSSTLSRLEWQREPLAPRRAASSDHVAGGAPTMSAQACAARGSAEESQPSSSAQSGGAPKREHVASSISWSKMETKSRSTPYSASSSSR